MGGAGGMVEVLSEGNGDSNDLWLGGAGAGDQGQEDYVRSFFDKLVAVFLEKGNSIKNCLALKLTT